MYKLSVFTVMIPDLTPEETAQALKQHGYDGVEWRVKDGPIDRNQAPAFWANNYCTLPLSDEGARRAKAAAGAAGLAMPGLGTYIDVGDVEAVEKAMSFARICGARNARVHPGNWPDPKGLSYADCFSRARRFLSECETLSKQYGVRAVIEMHHRTIVCSASLCRRLVEGFDPEHIGVIHDAGNGVYEGFEDYDMAFQMLGPYLTHVHVKNAKYVDRGDGVWEATWAALENGVVNWQNLFGALKKANYSGWLGLEDFSGAYATNAALPHDIQFLKATIARVQGE
jgi:sugar phosphate isomerase/epimerase